MERAVRYILSHLPHHPTAGQQNACRAVAEFLYDPDPASAFVLKGYAGTGKTTLVGALIRSAPALGLKTVLLAPTGRAAKVLSSLSGRKAGTIHKKIYQTATDGSGALRVVRAPNKHSYTLFIVDEASMIGLADELSPSSRSLLDDLVGYVAGGSHCRLMLIGDSAQLPPVGAPESPALDIDFLQAATGLKVRTAELTEVVRQGKSSGILYNATLLRSRIAALAEGEAPQLPLFDIEGCDDIVRLSGADLEETLNRAYGPGPESAAIVTRSNKRANLFNQEVRNRILCREEEVNAGDYLMVVRNNYYWLEPDSEIGFAANGDIVEVMAVRHRRQLYGFHFADAALRFVDYPESPAIDCKLLLETLHSESPSLTRQESQRLFDGVMADFADLHSKADRMAALRQSPYFNALQVKFAYALTCHKTQGGQWDTVVVDQGCLTDDMVDRDYLRWLYTAVTRATRKVYLLNFADRFFSTPAAQ